MLSKGDAADVINKDCSSGKRNVLSFGDDFFLKGNISSSSDIVWSFWIGDESSLFDFVDSWDVVLFVLMEAGFFWRGETVCKSENDESSSGRAASKSNFVFSSRKRDVSILINLVPLERYCWVE